MCSKDLYQIPSTLRSVAVFIVVNQHFNMVLQMPSSLPHTRATALTEHDKHHIYAQLPADVKVLALASVQVYDAPFGGRQESWKFTGLKGMLVFGRNRLVIHADKPLGKGPGTSFQHQYWLRLVDMTPGKGLIWTYEIPEDFRYRLDKPFFHVFPGKARMLGLRFDDDAEAGAFYKKITVQTRANVLPPRKITKSVSKPPPHQNASQLKLSTISAPAAGTFVHVSHVGFNNKGRLEASDNLSPTWKVMLEEIQGRGLTLDKLLRRRANDRAPPPRRDHVEGSVELTKPAKEPGEKKRRSPHRKPVALA